MKLELGLHITPHGMRGYWCIRRTDDEGYVTTNLVRRNAT